MTTLIEPRYANSGVESVIQGDKNTNKINLSKIDI